MFDAALEYRKFIQSERTDVEKKTKLNNLAVRERVHAKINLPLEEVVKLIMGRFSSGDDLLDPAIFDRESIEEFAQENNIEQDPLVRQFIQIARPAAEWVL